MASYDYVYKPCSLFWPDVIFLTAPKLDWGQAVGMAISVQRVVSMDPQLIIIAGSNDHLQSRGLLTRLMNGSIPSNEVMGEAIMTLMSTMTEAETSIQQRFTRNVVKIVFILSPGYATLPEPLHFHWLPRWLPHWRRDDLTWLFPRRKDLLIQTPITLFARNSLLPGQTSLTPYRDSKSTARPVIASFVKDVRKLSIGLVLALYVTLSHENFVKGPDILFTQALADLRLAGFSP